MVWGLASAEENYVAATAAVENRLLHGNTFIQPVAPGF
jgi:hypothetical protein